MFNIQATGLARSKPASQVRRLGQHTFWLLFAFEGLLIAGILVLVLHLLLPVRAPLAQTSDYATVRAAIQSRLSGTTDDPLIEVAPGTTARLSSVSGFTLHGYTYYYYYEGRPGFDPFSRGALARDELELVSREQFDRGVVVIYRVLSKERATN